MAESVLVTGGGGFVGAALVRRLLRDGHPVATTVRPGADRWRLNGVRGDVQLLELDLRDRDTVANAIQRLRPAWVLHLAAHGAYPWQHDPATVMGTGVLGTMHVLEAAIAADVGSIVNAGSSSEYGGRDHAPSEGEVLEPNSAYAVAKAAATLYGQWVARSQNRAVTTLRLYSIYGPWEEPRRLVPTLVTHGLRGALPPLVDPATVRDFVYVDDACDAFVRAARAAEGGAGRIYNVASGEQTSLRKLVEVARELFGITQEPEWGSYPAREWDTTVWVGDPSRIRAELGWFAQRSLSDGLAYFATWIGSGADVTRRYGISCSSRSER